VIVETKVLGQVGELSDREVTLPAGTGTLRDLLTELVRLEVDRYEQRRAEQLVLRILTPADFARAPDVGRVVSGGRVVPAAASTDVAVERALEAFRDGLYLVVFDGSQIEDLDTAVVVTSESRLRLVRLVALSGG